MLRTSLVITCAIMACKTNDAAKPAPTLGSSAPITPIVADAAPTAPAIGDRTIRRDGVGPINARTPATLDALVALFPDLEVVPSANRGDAAELDDTPRVEIGDQLLVPTATGATTVNDVEVLANGFATRAKIHVGSSVGDLAAAAPTATCRLFAADNATELTCHVPGEPELVYTIEDGGFTGKAGTVAPADIARRAITQITWRAR